MLKFRSKQKGAVLIELAIVIPLLLLLTLVPLEISHAISEYKVLVNQVESAARYLSTKTPGLGRAEAICLVRTSSLSCSATPVLAGLALSGATVSVYDAVNAASTQKSQKTSSDTNSVRINLVTVKVTGYQYNLSIGDFAYGIFQLPATLDFGEISSTMRQIN